MRTRTALPLILLLLWLGWSRRKTRDTSLERGHGDVDRKNRELKGTTTTTNTEGKVKPTNKGDAYESQTTSTEAPNYDDFMVYTMDAANLPILRNSD